MLRGKNKRYTAIFIFFYLPFLPFQTPHTYPLRRECLPLLRFWRKRRASGQLIQGKEKKRAEAGRENFFTASSSYCTCVKVRERERRRRSVNLGQILSPPPLLLLPPPPPPIFSSHSFLSHTHRERGRKENPFLSIPGLGRQVSKENKSPLKYAFTNRFQPAANLNFPPFLPIFFLPMHMSDLLLLLRTWRKRGREE